MFWFLLTQLVRSSVLCQLIVCFIFQSFHLPSVKVHLHFGMANISANSEPIFPPEAVISCGFYEFPNPGRYWHQRPLITQPAFRAAPSRPESGVITPSQRPSSWSLPFQYKVSKFRSFMTKITTALCGLLFKEASYQIVSLSPR